MSQNTKMSDYDKYITLNGLKEFYKLLNKNFVATEKYCGGIKTGYLTDYDNKKYAIKLENGHAYVNVPWISNTATQSANGLMHSDDKKKLDGIEAGANKYSLSVATGDVLGGIKIGYKENGKNYPVQLSDGKAYVNVPWTDNTITAATGDVLGGIKIGYKENGKNYPVQLSDGKAYVNVPWTDNNTTYSAASQSAAGLMSADDKKKLDGIEAGANKYSLSVATGDVLGGIKIGYKSTRYQDWAVQLDNSSNAYVTCPWSFGTGITAATNANSTGMTVKASLVSETYNEKDSSKTNSSNTNRFYPVELDKSGKLAVTVPWENTQTIYTGKDGVNVSSSNEIALDLYKVKSTAQGGGLNVDVYNPITISTKIPETWETTNAEQLYPVIFDGNNKLSVLVKWANTWQANTKNQAGYVAAPPKDSSMQVWMTNTYGIPGWVDLPEPTVTVPQASSVVLGGIKLGYSRDNDNSYSKGRRYGVDITDAYCAFIEIGTASKSNMGVVKVLGETTSTEVAVKINDNGALYVDPLDIPKSDSSGGSFTLGSANNTELGGIKTGYNGGEADDKNKNYPVQLDEESKAYVNVPWDKYTFGDGLSQANNNKVSLKLLDSTKTEDEVSKITWKVGSNIPENCDYYNCPVCIDKKGNLYVRVPAIALGSLGGGISPINDNE